jgi:hypothetical protein
VARHDHAGKAMANFCWRTVLAHWSHQEWADAFSSWRMSHQHDETHTERSFLMDSLAQVAYPTATARPERRRVVGWSAITSGVALVIVGEKPYFPASLSLFLLIASLALFLSMLPVAMWLAKGVAEREGGSAGLARIAQMIGFAGVLVAIATVILALPRWLPAVPAQILETSSLGIIGLWLLLANGQAFGVRLINRVLAVFGAIAGLSLLLAAIIMWVELAFGDLGSLTSTFENIRMLGGYLGEALYLIWALWLGIWLLVRRKR